MTPDLAFDLVIVALACVAAPLVSGVLLGLLIHWTIEYAEAVEEERRTVEQWSASSPSPSSSRWRPPPPTPGP